MNKEIKEILLQKFKAGKIVGEEIIQNLWSNYGQILRVNLVDSDVQSVIVKNITSSELGNHPRGWNTNISHDRKVKSYEVETNWYNQWSNICNDACRVAKCYLIKNTSEGKVIVLEDLNQAGFTVRKSDLTIEQTKVCLAWLANFHALFLNEEPKGLWVMGTYWHLATRPDELNTMEDSPLKQAAHKIDEILNNCQYRTFVHGDAKVANFCFTKELNNVAAVDFQYVGGGCGMKDVIYLLSSCLTEQECEKHEKELLDYYFLELKTALSKTNKSYSFNALELEWREMYTIAWADFTRFLLGWAPTHQKLNSYSLTIVNQVLNKITQ